MKRDELQLLDRIRIHDRDAFDKLFRRWYSVLVAYACQYVDLPEAENIVQDVMLVFWKRSLTTDIKQSLSSYLHAAVRNRCLNHLEHESVGERYISETRLSVIEEATETDPAVLREMEIILQTTLRQLPDDQRSAFEQSRFKGLKYDQIAASAGVSVKTVEYRISRALAALRSAFSDWLK